MGLAREIEPQEVRGDLLHPVEALLANRADTVGEDAGIALLLGFRPAEGRAEIADMRRPVLPQHVQNRRRRPSSKTRCSAANTTTCGRTSLETRERGGMEGVNTDGVSPLV